MTRKSITEAAASGDMSAAISEGETWWKPTHRISKTGERVALLNDGAIDRDDGTVGAVRQDGGVTWLDKNEIEPLEAEKPEWKGTHLLERGSTIYKVQLLAKKGVSANVQFATGDTELVFLRDLKPVQPKVERSKWEWTHTHTDLLTGTPLMKLRDTGNGWCMALPFGGHPCEYCMEELVEHVAPKPAPVAEVEPEELVEFTITRAMFQAGPIQDLIERVFHFDPSSYTVMEPLKVTCRPDQFGRFCAMLAARGRNLNYLISVRLFTPQPEKKPNAIDARYLGVKA